MSRQKCSCRNDTETCKKPKKQNCNKKKQVKAKLPAENSDI